MLESASLEASNTSPTILAEVDAKQASQSPTEPSAAFNADTFVFDLEQDDQSHASHDSVAIHDADTIPLDPSLLRSASKDLDFPTSTSPEDDEEDYLNDFKAKTTMNDQAVLSLEGSPSFDDVFQSDAVDTSNDNLEPSIFPSQDQEMIDPFYEEMSEDIEEICDEGRLTQNWPMAYPSPSPSESPSLSGSPTTLATLCKTPNFNPFGTEMLIARFASETCGILSIKDGQHENPWRTMLLPMSFGVPALHHAILALSAFHASRDDTRFRIPGLKNMQKSIQYLSKQLSVLRRDTALATTLVLAFSESWHEETSTGIRHLKAARTLVTQAIANNKDNPDFEELERLKFLRNTWVYMDVIARITAIDCDDSENIDKLFAPVYGPDHQDEDLDPLMGCASRLFPLIGDVANLVREIRKLKSSSPRIVSRAADLKAQILKWRAPLHLRVPQDESIDVSHALNTAEAYRWSAILFLYQAVPMIATESAADLAERILYHLVAVPLSSRVIIIQIFPLLVAGCEMTGEENRSLVKDRWRSMTNRMAIGNLDRCSDVVDEVWARRDSIMEVAQNRTKSDMMHDAADELPFPLRRGSTLAPTKGRPSVVRPDQLYRQCSENDIDIEQTLTVKGYGHWLTVMEDWNWAGKSSFIICQMSILMKLVLLG